MEGKENHGRNWERSKREEEDARESLRRRKRRRRRGPTRLLSFFASERVRSLFSKRSKKETRGERSIAQRGRDEEELRKNDEGYETRRRRRRRRRIGRRAGLFFLARESIFFICERCCGR